MTVSSLLSRASTATRYGAIAATIALLAALLSVGGGVASARADGTASVSGTVQGAGTPNSSLSGASVFLYAPGLQPVAITTTDENGNFSFSGVVPGSYTLDIQGQSSGNYAEQWWNNKADYASADYFSLTDGQSLTGMNVVLALGSTLSGSVMGAGAPVIPIEGSYVSLVSANGLQHASAFSNAQGNFTITGIEAGSYALEFAPPFGSSTYLPQWWQNQSASATAQTVTIGASQNLAGYNAILQFAASISGRVIGADTLTGLPGATVEALQDGATGGFASVAADGSYTLDGLVPGSYTLSFSPAYGQDYLAQYWKDQPTLARANTISVVGGDALTGIDATLAVGASVSGVVTTSETPGVGLAGASVLAVDSTGNYAGSANTNADGTYSIVGLSPATYRIQFQAPYGDSHGSQFWKSAPTFEKAVPLTVAANTVTTGINATLTEGATISGTVTESGDPTSPIPNVDVLAESPAGTFVAMAVTDQSGNYTLTGLPAATLIVKFAGSDDRAYTPSWWRNASKLSAATRIKLTGGAALTGISGTLARAYLAPGHPTVAGAARVGSTLTAKPGKWKPVETTFTYQWSRDGSAISGAINSTYVPVNADAGHTLTVAVTGEDYNYPDVTVTSPASKPVTGGTLATATPQVAGTATRGAVLTADPGIWGPGTVALTYRWSRGGIRISGATGPTYTVAKADAGKQLTVTVTGSEIGFTTASETSQPTAAVG